MIARGAAAILKVGEKRDRASNRSALARGRRGGGAAGGRATTHGCRGAGEDLASCSPPPAVACSAARRSPRAQWTAAAADGVRGFEGISSLSPLCRFSLLLCSCRKGGEGSVVRPGDSARAVWAVALRSVVYCNFAR